MQFTKKITRREDKKRVRVCEGKRRKASECGLRSCVMAVEWPRPRRRMRKRPGKTIDNCINHLASMLKEKKDAVINVITIR